MCSKTGSRLLIAILFLQLLTVSEGYSQLERGIRFHTTLGKTFSWQLNKYQAQKENIDTYDSGSNAHATWGGGVGLGYFIKYNLNDKIAFVGELSLNYQTSHYYITTLRDSVGNSTWSYKERISTKADLMEISVAMPLLFRYKLFPAKRYHLLAGPSIAFSSPVRFKSQEQAVYTTYLNGDIINTRINSYNQRTVLTNYKMMNISFILGIEKTCKRKWKNVTLGIWSSFTLLGGELASGQSSFDPAMQHNRFWSASSESSGTPSFTDFRSWKLSWFVRYKLHKASKEQ